MTKERGDGEPICETANHSGFGRRAHDAQPGPARFENSGDDEKHSGEDEQSGCPALHRVELCLSRRFVRKDLHRARLRRGDWPYRCRPLLRRRAVCSGERHRGVTFTLAKSTMLVLEPDGTST